MTGTSRDAQEAAKAVKEQLESVSQWCHDIESPINPNKSQTLCYTLASRAAGKAMPAVIKLTEL